MQEDPTRSFQSVEQDYTGTDTSMIAALSPKPWMLVNFKAAKDRNQSLTGPKALSSELAERKPHLGLRV